jgi:hypothetical protein
MVCKSFSRQLRRNSSQRTSGNRDESGRAEGMRYGSEEAFVVTSIAK